MNTTQLTLVCAITSALGLVATSVKAEDIDLSTTFTVKGYTIGLPMASCPAETIKHSEKDGTTTCDLGPTTYAGDPATTHTVSIYNGLVQGTMVNLSAKSKDANTAVLAAIKATYGNPNVSKDQLGEYVWQKGHRVLSLDMMRGTVVSSDLAVYRQSVAASSKAEAAPATLSKLPSIVATQTTGSDGRIASSAAIASASAFHLYTLNGITRINNATSISNIHGAYRNSVNDRAGATVAAGLIAALITAAIELERQRNTTVEVYGIKERNRAVDLLADLVYHQGRDLRAWDEAIEELRKDPKPEYGQLFVDATILTVEACNTTFRGKSDNWFFKPASICGRVFAVAKEARLPTEMDDGVSATAAKHLPQPATVEPVAVIETTTTGTQPEITIATKEN